VVQISCSGRVGLLRLNRHDGPNEHMPADGAEIPPMLTALIRQWQRVGLGVLAARTDSLSISHLELLSTELPATLIHSESAEEAHASRGQVSQRSCSAGVGPPLWDRCHARRGKGLLTSVTEKPLDATGGSWRRQRSRVRTVAVRTGRTRPHFGTPCLAPYHATERESTHNPTAPAQAHLPARTGERASATGAHRASSDTHARTIATG
jgi:hypothetical protein